MNQGRLKLIFYVLGSLTLGKAVRFAARRAWHKSTNQNPPDHIGSEHVKKSHAILWTLGLSMVTALSKMAFRSYFTEEHNQLHGYNESNANLIDREEI